jgi:hypothetical protein
MTDDETVSARPKRPADDPERPPVWWKKPDRPGTTEDERSREPDLDAPPHAQEPDLRPIPSLRADREDRLD